ncbi:hypothetical protein FNV43_RR15364 [Rhamnella rubrinervis]|uniref:Trichome birefringence-like N-terminal domain-containing protein n=1 Tax=Rhamnella rubrinervis TaxID=2594499 RepID=A0A8K0E8X3_9ROSA|nr:hypothetical protein FNV43_RR15364 [Rhamnella rubrinervis]
MGIFPNHHRHHSWWRSRLVRHAPGRDKLQEKMNERLKRYGKRNEEKRGDDCSIIMLQRETKLKMEDHSLSNLEPTPTNFSRAKSLLHEPIQQRHTEVEQPTTSAIDNMHKQPFVIEESCDLFTGHWFQELRRSLYTNSSCAMISDSKNCFKNGREDNEFLNWRWKPNECELPRFDPKAFLEMVHVGDSVSRNHMESLLCLLSPVSFTQLFFFALYAQF